MKGNPIAAAIESRGVKIPVSPIDISDIFRRNGVKNVYVIAMTGRCGSTWLASEISSLPNCGKPSEYFSEEMIPHVEPGKFFHDIIELFGSIVESGKTGDTFGFKIDGARLKSLSDIIDIRSSFGSGVAKWIDMRRLNIVKQAFSFARAKNTGVWHVYAGAERPNPEKSNKVGVDALSDEVIWREIDLLVKSEKALSEVYQDFDVRPLAIKYEEMVDSKMQILLQSLAHILPGRELPIIPDVEEGKTVKMAKTSPDPIELSFVRRNSVKINDLNISRGF